MKRFLSLLISIVLLLSFTAVATAASAEVTGNVRVWYKVTSDTNYFWFDRLALTFKESLSENHGFRGDLLFKQVDKNSQTSGDIRVTAVYFYQKNLLGNDELNIGYFDIPFYSDKTVALNATAGLSSTIYGSYSYNYLWPKQSLGLKYDYKADSFEVIAALTNAANLKNDNATVTGYDYAVRGLFTPITGLTFGLSYAKDVTDSAADNYNQDVVVDANFVTGPLGIFVEYDNQTPYSGGSTGTAKTGIYFEGTYKISDSFTAYIGGSPSAQDFTGNNSFYLAGGKYQLAPKATLQGEYLIPSGNSGSLNFRLKVDF
jgi:hypothetical protein